MVKSMPVHLNKGTKYCGCAGTMITPNLAGLVALPCA